MIKHIACLLLILSLPAFGLKNDEARYSGGTAANLKIGALCHISLSSNESLIIESAGQRLAIPYADIDSFQYSQELRWHLGVLPAIAIGLVRAWPRQHFFRIAFHDQHNIPQVAVLEVPKSTRRSLQAVLEIRTPHPCAPPAGYGTRDSASSCSNLLPSYAYRRRSSSYRPMPLPE